MFFFVYNWKETTWRGGGHFGESSIYESCDWTFVFAYLEVLDFWYCFILLNQNAGHVYQEVQILCISRNNNSKWFSLRTHCEWITWILVTDIIWYTLTVVLYILVNLVIPVTPLDTLHMSYTDLYVYFAERLTSRISNGYWQDIL